MNPYCVAAAAAKPLQSCPTLWDPIDGSPPGSAIPGILQARSLESVAISFSNAWKWKVKKVAQSCPTLCNPMDCSLPGSSVHGIFQARVLEWGAIAFSTMDMRLCKLQLLVMHRKAWCAIFHGVAKSRTRLSDWTELNWTEDYFHFLFFLTRILIIFCPENHKYLKAIKKWRVRF